MARGNHITRNGLTRPENRKYWAQRKEAQQRKRQQDIERLNKRFKDKGLDFDP